ncbi:hypothetical protein ABXJ76_15585 [Methylobacter sp. G7]|uniref:hypothetical protein n=1 Tax=Methylobacter sp. G7 TaxID=3230117 RepID=UPI003D806A20
MSLKNRLAALEAMARSVRKIVRFWHVVLDDTDEAQAKEIAAIEKQGGKVRLFHVVE